MSKLEKGKRARLRTWIEIDTGRARRNFYTLKKILGKQVKFAAVTKSNAYGHGLIGYSKLMQKFGADWICVDSILEAEALREHGIKIPILVMGYTLPVNFSLAEKHDIKLTISSFENLKTALQHPRVSYHLKFDTGFSRQGFLPEETDRVLKTIGNKKEIIQGVYTHLAKAKAPDKRSDTDRQIKAFQRVISVFKAAGLKPILHAGATAGAIVYPETRFDMARLGIGTYGLWPEQGVRDRYEKQFELQPVLSWKTILSEIKTLSAGRRVGYDLTHRLRRRSKVAVCPVGYWHGYSRALSNKSSVLVRGQRAPLLGRVSMGMIVIDVTDIKGIKAGDEVALIGRQGDEEITADELARLAETINYEIVTRINPYSRRFYV